MRVALFGGSFNPPHVAHQLAALYVLETAPVDELWFVPAFQHPFDKPLEPFRDRFRMCELMAAALGARVRVSDIEALLEVPSRTLRTVRKLIEDHPGTEFSLVVGSDLLSEIDSWRGSAELRKLVPLIVVARGGHPDRGREDRASLSSAAMPAVSSTEIRAALAEGRDVSSLVPKTVLDYITARGLYRSPERD
jgi:nicotinate-nucleotide adenylyltransferase